MTKENIDNDPYKSAGVDISAGNDLIDRIKKDVSSTQNNNVLGGIGGFAGMYKLGDDIKKPVLVACTDGVVTVDPPTPNPPPLPPPLPLKSVLDCERNMSNSFSTLFIFPKSVSASKLIVMYHP